MNTLDRIVPHSAIFVLVALSGCVVPVGRVHDDRDRSDVRSEWQPRDDENRRDALCVDRDKGNCLNGQV